MAERCRGALPVYNTDAPVIPLLASKCSNVFRLFSNDAGLLTSAYPIEVKSGKDYRSYKALDNFMNIQDYHLENAIVFSAENVEADNNITYLPIYMCYLLKEKKLDKLIADLDTTFL